MKTDDERTRDQLIRDELDHQKRENADVDLILDVTAEDADWRQGIRKILAEREKDGQA